MLAKPMKKLASILLTFIISTTGYPQINFEKGYVINNANQKINCLIKNVGWQDNPTAIDYKLDEKADKTNATIEDIKEFAVLNEFKYIRSEVMIDRSGSSLKNLSSNRKAEFQKETLFLKVILEGKASLYYYEDKDLRRFFYNVDNGEIKQLTFKEYYNKDNKIATNDRYKQELWNHLQCSTINMSKVKGLSYKKRALTKFFQYYNDCHQHQSINYDQQNKDETDLFRLNLRPGVNSSTLTIQNQLLVVNARKISGIGFRLGTELEFLMPFNQGKWAIILEPTYQSFNQTIEDDNIEVNYQSVEVPFGLRHYFFFNQNSKIFINGALVLDFPFASTLKAGTNTNLELNSRINFALGMGYKFMDRYSLELRYLSNREILSDYQSWYTEFQTISFSLGYSIL